VLMTPAASPFSRRTLPVGTRQSATATMADDNGTASVHLSNGRQLQWARRRPLTSCRGTSAQREKSWLPCARGGRIGTEPDGGRNSGGRKDELTDGCKRAVEPSIYARIYANCQRNRQLISMLHPAVERWKNGQ
jgi:hypothetical protein